MAIKTQAHEEHLNNSKVRFLSILSFFLGFLDAFFIYIISSYFVSVSGDQNVGSFYLVAFLIVLWILLTLGRFLRHLGQIRLILFILVLLVGSAAFLSLREPSWVGAAVLLLFLIMNNVMWVVLDVILESYSTDRMSGRVRGLYLTVMNAGLLCAPILSTQTLDHFGYGGIFTALTLGYAMVTAAMLLGLHGERRIEFPELTLPRMWQKLKGRKNLLRIYHISFAMEFFYAIMLVYTPIYLTVVVGFRWEELGLVFTMMLVPFVVLQYPLGLLADTHWGEKELLLMGLVVIAFGTALVGMIDSMSVFVWGMLLLLTRIGAATIEVLRDSYFYKQIDERDSDIIAFFRTARPVGNIAGALGASIFLLFFPLEGLFFLIVLVTLSALWSGFALEDSASEREQQKMASIKA